MTTARHGVPPQDWLPENPQASDIDQIQTFLEEQGTFVFPTLSSGLFSAAASDDPEFRLTGYQNVWTRDNVHVAYGLWIAGETEKAARAIASLLDFYIQGGKKIDSILSGELDAVDTQSRPHIRFDGETLAEIDVAWAHAQNDALGYLLWISTQMLSAGHLQATPQRLTLFRKLLDYLVHIEYWRDEDSGHWEETRKIEASSIGTVVAGLSSLRTWLADHPSDIIDPVQLNDAIEQGRRALVEILPAECIQPEPNKHRLYDAALLFLIYPLNVVDDETASQIIANVDQHLTSPIGIRRYIGDSYWCADYRDLVAAEKRTTDFSEDTSIRDGLLKPGQEAQWCIFDPILSVIHGQRFQETRDQAALAKQIHHLRRSLAQLTTADSRFPAYRCPESYFLEHGQWIPNDITPLLWTQANLLQALHGMKRSVQS